LENKTWELVIIPKGISPLQNKWVYMLKHEGEENKEISKSRLMVKGFSQKQGTDFIENFHPLLKCH